MNTFDTTDALTKAFDALAEHWLRANSEENTKIIKQIVESIVHVERNNIHAEWKLEVILNILRTIATITENNDLKKEIEKIEKLHSLSK